MKKQLLNIFAAGVLSLGLSTSVMAESAEAAPSLLEQGMSFWEKGDLEAAEQSFKQAIEQGDSAANMKLAGLYLSTQRGSQSIPYYQQAIAENGKNAPAFIGMALGYMHTGQLGLAIAALEEAVETDPTTAEKVQPMIERLNKRLDTIATAKTTHP